MGALRSLAAVLPPTHRASVMAAFFVVAYSAISVPAIGAGVAAVHIGLELGGDLVRLAVALLAAARRDHRLERAPAGRRDRLTKRRRVRQASPCRTRRWCTVGLR